MNLLYALMFAVGVNTETTVQTVQYCPKPHRSRTQVARFKRSTEYPKGRPGFVVDHKMPLCACGKDEPANMQWQSREESLRKDVLEKKLCSSLAYVVKLSREFQK